MHEVEYLISKAPDSEEPLLDLHEFRKMFKRDIDSVYQHTKLQQLEGSFPYNILLWNDFSFETLKLIRLREDILRKWRILLLGRAKEFREFMAKDDTYYKKIDEYEIEIGTVTFTSGMGFFSRKYTTTPRAISEIAKKVPEIKMERPWFK